MTDKRYEDLVQNHAPDMIERLITTVTEAGPVDIHHDFSDDDQWAIISMHIYEEDKEISLRLHLNDKYDLYFGYYDDEDEFFEIIHVLTEEEKKGIPAGLQKLMKRVLDTEEGIRVPANLIRS